MEEREKKRKDVNLNNIQQSKKITGWVACSEQIRVSLKFSISSKQRQSYYKSSTTYAKPFLKKGDKTQQNISSKFSESVLASPPLNWGKKHKT